MGSNRHHSSAAVNCFFFGGLFRIFVQGRFFCRYRCGVQRSNPVGDDIADVQTPHAGLSSLVGLS
jgi:hypothetical protein